MPSNDYAFLTRWQVEGKAEEAYEILTDLPGYLRRWHEVYLVWRKLHLPLGTASAKPTAC
jgi:hypothetical protein